MANYPGALPSTSPATHQVVLDEIVAIATELGLNPSGASATVTALLATLGNTTTVVQVTDNVIPTRPSGVAYVIWQCWDDPAANALADDTWRQVPAP